MAAFTAFYDANVRTPDPVYRKRPPKPRARTPSQRLTVRAQTLNLNSSRSGDLNVLYPAELRSLLIYLALTGLFRAKWSNAVHEDRTSNLLLNRPLQ